MIQQGLIDEVSRLAKMGYLEDLISLQSVGYKEVFKYLKRILTYESMVELIKQKSRNYAKRQLTWFKKDKRIIWFKCLDVNEIATKIETIVNNKQFKK